jgi:hypothetical protein
LAARLKRPPFNAWKNFRQHSERDLTNQPTVTAEFELPNGKRSTLTYLEHQTDGKKHRLKLRLAVLDGDKKVLNTTFVLDEGGVVLQAGQTHEKGMLILALSCEGD